jgi:hypothetical protein
MHPQGPLLIGTLLQFSSPTTATILVDGPQPWVTEVFRDSIRGMMIPRVPIPELKMSAKEVSKPAPKAQIASKATQALKPKVEKKEVVKTVSEPLLVASQAVVSVAMADDFPPLPVKKVQEQPLKAKVQPLKAKAEPLKAETVKATNAKTASIAKSGLSHEEGEKEVCEFVESMLLEELEKKQTPAQLAHTKRGSVKAHISFPPFLKIGESRICVIPHFNKKRIIKLLKNDLGEVAEEAFISITYAFEQLPSGKLKDEVGKITAFVAWGKKE